MAKHELKRILSKRGYCSRKEAESLILSAQVKANGSLCLDPLKFFDADVPIHILNTTYLKPAQIQYFAYHKPRGVVVSRKDEKNRTTLFDLLPSLDASIQAVGRLDMASEGLILLTNDHQWANQLMNPESHVAKVYRVQVHPIPSMEQLEKLSRGIQIEDELTKPAVFKIHQSGQKNAWLEVTLSEGKNRQIRKMLAYFQIEVLRLIRIQIGLLKLGELKKGELREIEACQVS